MNKTERKAKKWIMSLGYSESDIVFQNLDSPDFLLADGKSIEVKRIAVNSHTLVIDKVQWLKLKARRKCSIAIFNDKSKTPLAVLKVSKIKPPFGGEGYAIKIRGDGLDKWRRHLWILKQLRGPFSSRAEFWRQYHAIKDAQ